MTLYEIGENYRALAELLESEEVTPEEVADTFAAIEDAAGAKIDAIGWLFRNQMRMAEALKAQEAEFAQMRKRKERAMERLKGLCLTYLTLTDKRQAAGDLFTIKRRKNPARVIVSDEAAVPREFIREKVTTSVDKTAIKKALNAGQAVTGAFLEQGESVVFE